mgnify:CR=1 FL=1
MHIDPDADRQMQSTLACNGSRHPWARLINQLLALTDGHGVLLSHAESPWASATFCGSKHVVQLSFEGDDAVSAAESFILGLPDHEFTIAGHIVADAAITEVSHAFLPHPRLWITTELLLVQDG